MADFNVVLTVGDWQNGRVNTVVEIPKGSTLKIEWDRKRAAFMLDRVEPAIFVKPTNYGFIPQTLDEDGDELDTLIVTDEPLTTGIWLEAKVVGVLNFEDDGDMDYKIVVVPADDRNTGDSINSLDDLINSCVAGGCYLNWHTTASPGGALRVNLCPVNRAANTINGVAICTQ